MYLGVSAWVFIHKNGCKDVGFIEHPRGRKTSREINGLKTELIKGDVSKMVGGLGDRGPVKKRFLNQKEAYEVGNNNGPGRRVRLHQIEWRHSPPT